MSLLDVRGLRVSYEGVDVVRGLDFSLQAGETLALVGESGAASRPLRWHCSGCCPAMPDWAVKYSSRGAIYCSFRPDECASCKATQWAWFSRNRYRASTQC